MKTRTKPETVNANGQYEFRHRNPLARDFVVVSRVVLIGYPEVSDGAKVTYWVIYDHDWYEQGRGRKGFAFPSVRRLAQIRHAADRTIQRHLGELTEAGLLTRELRPGKPSILYIEEPGEPETQRYLEAQGRGGDKNVTPPPTKMSPHKQDEEKKEKPVNAVEKNVMEERTSDPKGWTRIGEVASRRSRLSLGPKGRTEWLVQEMATATGDDKSLGCYRVIAGRCDEALIFEGLALLKDARAARAGVRNQGAFFVSTVRRLCQESGLTDPLRAPEGKSVAGTIRASP